MACNFIKKGALAQVSSCEYCATLLKKRLWHRCFPVNFVKFLTTTFLQNTSEHLLLKQINILRDKGRTKCLWISNGKNVKQQWLIKIKRRNIQSIQQARISQAYCIGLNSGWKMMRFQLALNKTFCPSLQFINHQQVKQLQRTKINKTMLSAPSLPPLVSFPHK